MGGDFNTISHGVARFVPQLITSWADLKTRFSTLGTPTLALTVTLTLTLTQTLTLTLTRTPTPLSLTLTHGTLTLTLKGESGGALCAIHPLLLHPIPRLGRPIGFLFYHHRTQHLGRRTDPNPNPNP